MTSCTSQECQHEERVDFPGSAEIWWCKIFVLGFIQQSAGIYFCENISVRAVSYWLSFLNSFTVLDSNLHVIYYSTIYTVHAFREGKSGIISISVKFHRPLHAALSSATLTELTDREREREGEEVDLRWAEREDIKPRREGWMGILAVGGRLKAWRSSSYSIVLNSTEQEPTTNICLSYPTK